MSTETTAIKDGDGLDLTVVVKDGGLHTYFADNWVASYTLPDSVKDKKVQVGYFAWDTASNAVFYYGISEETPSLTAATDIKVEKPDGIAASVTADKTSYAMGETVTLDFPGGGAQAVRVLKPHQKKTKKFQKNACNPRMNVVY